jgi:AraC-like DNA-binding protein
VHIQKLFETEGTTFTEYVMERRLVEASRMLSDPRFADRTISEVAGNAGFGDLSYFNRAFRRLYGATPSDVRAAAQREWE